VPVGKGQLAGKGGGEAYQDNHWQNADVSAQRGHRVCPENYVGGETARTVKGQKMRRKERSEHLRRWQTLDRTKHSCKGKSAVTAGHTSEKVRGSLEVCPVRGCIRKRINVEIEMKKAGSAQSRRRKKKPIRREESLADLPEIKVTWKVRTGGGENVVKTNLLKF